MMAEGAPPMRSFLIGALQLEGEAPPKEGTTAFISFNGVQPDYFRQMGIRILQGTTISDTTEKSTQVMVNEGFARKFWHGENAVGRRLGIVYNGKGDWMTIVGVAANAFTSGLTSEATDPMLYMPFHGRYQPSLIVRATPGTNAIATVRFARAGDRPPSAVAKRHERRGRDAGEHLGAALHDDAARLLHGAGARARGRRALRRVGLCGGAADARDWYPHRVRRDAADDRARDLGQGALLAVCGIVIGLGGAYWATKFIDKMLYGVPRGDPYSFAAGALLLFGTAMAACLGADASGGGGRPAHRHASGVAALRADRCLPLPGCRTKHRELRRVARRMGNDAAQELDEGGEVRGGRAGGARRGAPAAMNAVRA